MKGIKKMKVKTLAERAKMIIKDCDTYGVPIQFQFKNESQYKSVLGGSLTILAFLGILVYFLILLQQVITRQNYTVTVSQSKVDFNDQSKFLNLNSDNFDLGILITCGRNCPFKDPNASIHQYFSAQIYNYKLDYTSQFLNLTKTPIGLVPCDE